MKKQMATPDFVPQGGTSPGKQKKIDTVTELTDKVGKAKSIVLADYRGLKHKQLEELRRALKKTDADFAVTKNRLLTRAFGKKAKSIENQLKQSTAALFAYADEVTPLTVLLKFFKTAGAGNAKGGLLGDKVLTEADVVTLASLPSRPVLLAKLVGQLNAPIQGLHDALSWNLNKLVWALNAVKKQKDSVI
ncbi:MAG: 50S ribosomal protein L10 [Candidatus Gottesmanbacteria bacterium]|nr:50S ribosomal protein L10 [Candidatus Gottesmanbacteria bacterium]